MAGVGWIPLVGDLAKGGTKVGKKVASEAADAVQKKADEAVSAVNESAQAQLKKAEAKVDAEIPVRKIGDDENVVRAGTKDTGGGASPEGISGGSGVRTDSSGNVHGVSVQAGPLSPEELANRVRNQQYGVTTAGAIRDAGGTVVHKPSWIGDFHSEVGSISPFKLSELLKPRKKPPTPKPPLR